MSYSTNIRTNIQQNAPDFILPSKQPAIFSKGLFTKKTRSTSRES